jgi:hypothetical protein
LDLILLRLCVGSPLWSPISDSCNPRPPWVDVVKILADREPVPPTRQPFELVEFEGLVVTPYVNDKGRMAYSLRATGLKPATARQPAKDAA